MQHSIEASQNNTQLTNKAKTTCHRLNSLHSITLKRYGSVMWEYLTQTS